MTLGPDDEAAAVSLQGPSVSVTYQPRSEDWRRAAADIARYSISGNALGTVLIISGAVSLLILGGDVVPVDVSVFFILMGGLQLTGWLTGLLAAWRTRRRMDRLASGVSLRIDANGLQTATATQTSSAGWAAYRRVRETSRDFFFDRGTAIYTIIPKRVFDDEALEAIRGWARGAGVLDERPQWRFMAIGIMTGLLACGAVAAVAAVLFAIGLPSG